MLISLADRSATWLTSDVEPRCTQVSQDARWGMVDGVSEPDRLTCAHCGREGTSADVVAGWSVSTPPRPTGSSQPRSTEVRALCPACARSVLRDLEGKLDP
jgi:hypothetical protein